MGAWYIRVIGARRQEIDMNLLTQAVIALGEQIHSEEQTQTGERPEGVESAEEAS